MRKGLPAGMGLECQAYVPTPGGFLLVPCTRATGLDRCTHECGGIISHLTWRHLLVEQCDQAALNFTPFKAVPVPLDVLKISKTSFEEIAPVAIRSITAATSLVVPVTNPKVEPRAGPGPEH
jgi:hypothetical protein